MRSNSADLLNVLASSNSPTRPKYQLPSPIPTYSSVPDFIRMSTETFLPVHVADERKSQGIATLFSEKVQRYKYTVNIFKDHMTRPKSKVLSVSELSCHGTLVRTCIKAASDGDNRNFKVKKLTSFRKGRCRLTQRQASAIIYIE